MNRLSSLTVLFLVGCFNPDLSNTSFICDTNDPGMCPDGLVCRNQRCQDPSAPATLVDGGSADGIVTTPTDLGGTLPSNCESVDRLSPPEVAECKGKFATATQAQLLCPSGWSVCSTWTPTTLDSKKCADTKAKGFFAANIPTWHDPAIPNGRGSCAAMSSWPAGPAGCGIAAGATSSVPVCSGWPFSLHTPKATMWTSFDGTINTTTNSDPASGVMCCAP